MHAQPTSDLENPGEKRIYSSFRPVALPRSLADLQANHSGIVTLPISLDWSPAKRFDLGIQRQELRFIEKVLNEAATAEVLAEYLNGERLIQLWPKLMPARLVRAAWERRFPGLASL